MTDDSSSPQSANSWREKYLANVESFEQKQAEFEKTLDMYQRSLVRVSLAADGVDHQLDEHLGNLRQLIRSKSTTADLEQLTENIEEQVRKLDENRKEGHCSLVNAYNQLLEAVSIPAISSVSFTKFKQLTQQIIEHVDDPAAHMRALLDYLSCLIELIVEELIPQEGSTPTVTPNVESTPEKARGWHRWFKGAADKSASLDVQQEATSDDSIDLEARSQAFGTETSDDDCQVDSGQYNLDMIRERVVGVLLTIIDQLYIAPSLSTLEGKVRRSLKEGFDWPELPVLLSELNVLISGSGTEAQKDFEVFLVSLNDRLGDIHTFLSNTQRTEVDIADQSREFDRKVRDEISVLQSSLTGSTDLKEIKSVISVRLDGILTTMDAFQRTQATSRDVVIEQISELNQRMEAMESDAQDLKKALNKQRTQAMKDSLTNLPNRQAYLETASKEIARANRHSLNLALSIMDIDLFKRINDSFGHLSGDKVLKIVANGLLKNMRESDFVARYGGEEFIILLPETDLKAGMIPVDKVRASIANIPFHFRNERVQVTASFGVTQIYPDESLNAAFARADKALYRAKQNGRNRVESMDR